MADYKKIVGGLEIIAKYDGDRTYVAAEHDVIFAGPRHPEKVTIEDRKALEKLGWHFDDEVDSWARFV